MRGRKPVKKLQNVSEMKEDDYFACVVKERTAYKHQKIYSHTGVVKKLKPKCAC